jgi:hypothetical protein
VHNHLAIHLIWSITWCYLWHKHQFGHNYKSIPSENPMYITKNEKMQKKKTRILLHITRLGSLWLDIFIPYPMGMTMSTIQMIATLFVLLVIFLPFNWTSFVNYLLKKWKIFFQQEFSWTILCHASSVAYSLASRKEDENKFLAIQIYGSLRLFKKFYHIWNIYSNSPQNNDHPKNSALHW